MLLRRKQRSNQIDRLDAHHFVALALEISDAYFRERLERGAEAAPDRARAVRPTLAFAVIRRDEDDEFVALARRNRVQDDGLGALRLHDDSVHVLTSADHERAAPAVVVDPQIAGRVRAPRNGNRRAPNDQSQT